MQGPSVTSRDLLVGKGTQNDIVYTGNELLDGLVKEFGFRPFDPCPANPTFDGLSISWTTLAEDGQRDNRPVYVNPPYSAIEQWMIKAMDECVYNEVHSVFMVPMRSNNRYWYDIVWTFAHRVIPLQGRVRFISESKGIPLPIVLVEFMPPRWRPDLSSEEAQVLANRWVLRDFVSPAYHRISGYEVYAIHVRPVFEHYRETANPNPKKKGRKRKEAESPLQSLQPQPSASPESPESPESPNTKIVKKRGRPKKVHALPPTGIEQYCITKPKT